MKYCTLCKVEKPLTEFFKSGFQKNGTAKRRPDCKECSKKSTASWRERNRSRFNNYAAMWRSRNPEKQMATDIKRLYGLELSTYNSLLNQQDYKCSICKKEHNPSVKKGRLAVDHCHSTGKIRGLLCLACNVGIGNLRDSPELLQAAIDYLKTH